MSFGEIAITITLTTLGLAIGMHLASLQDADQYRARCEGNELVIEYPYDTVVARKANHHLCLRNE